MSRSTNFKATVPLFNRREFVAYGGAAAAVSCSRSQNADRPNIVFILADDLGYADLSCYGRREYNTPNIDALAAEGIRYLDAYSNSPVCSATRTALITGRYQYRLPVGLEEPLASRPLGLPPDHPTLPSLLKAAGYNTALVGKWHLGQLPDYGPLKSGYDHFWGFRGGGVDYFTHANFRGHDLWDGGAQVHENGYLTDLLGQRAIDMLDAFVKSPEPFFLSLHFNAPHWPWEGLSDEEEAARLASDRSTNIVHWDGGSAKTYAEMVQRLDYQVGRVLKKIKSLGIEENTIVVFTSDNGGERFSDVWPFSGRKTELLEGGIRVPAIARWPQRLSSGVDSAQICMSMDWMATFLSAANISPAPAFSLDGIDIFSNQQTDINTERFVFWRMKWMAQQACRRGKWKYLRIKENSFLFNLEADPLERANLKKREPNIFKSMLSAYKNWERSMLPLSPESEAHGFTGAQMADRYGSEY